MKSIAAPYEQKIAYARPSLWVPFYGVGMAARIQGDPSADLVEAALRKLRVLYPPLGSRVRVEADGSAWFTTQGVGDFLFEVRQKETGQDWAKLLLEEEQKPFDFERGPLARFFLLRGEESSDLVVAAPHVICDGYAMTQVMADAVALLNDPGRVVRQAEPPLPVNWETVPHSVFDNIFLRGFVRSINHIWPDGHLPMGQAEYEELHRCYWSKQRNGLLAFELAPTETASLAGRCKQQGVSVTGALLAAFLLAQGEICPKHWEMTVAANLRGRMLRSPGRAAGVFASSVDLSIPARPELPFWELARLAHTRLHRLINNRARLLRPMVLDELNPLIADNLLADICTGRRSKGIGLLSQFVKITGERRCLDVSNIGRVELPESGGPYRLETLLPFPPLVPGGRMALNVLTVNGRMHLILKYRQDELEQEAVAGISGRALEYLQGGFAL